MKKSLLLAAATISFSTPVYADSIDMAVPTPSTMLLLGFGLLGLAKACRKNFFK